MPKRAERERVGVGAGWFRPGCRRARPGWVSRDGTACMPRGAVWQKGAGCESGTFARASFDLKRRAGGGIGRGMLGVSRPHPRPGALGRRQPGHGDRPKPDPGRPSMDGSLYRRGAGSGLRLLGARSEACGRRGGGLQVHRRARQKAFHVERPAPGTARGFAAAWPWEGCWPSRPVPWVGGGAGGLLRPGVLEARSVSPAERRAYALSLRGPPPPLPRVGSSRSASARDSARPPAFRTGLCESRGACLGLFGLCWVVFHVKHGAAKAGPLSHATRAGLWASRST